MTINTDLLIVERGGVPRKETGAQLKAFILDGEGDRKRVATIAARDLITGLDNNDLVLVDDASADPTVTSGWAAYYPTTVTNGVADGWVKGINQEQLLAAGANNLSDADVAAGTATTAGQVTPKQLADNFGSKAKEHDAVTAAGTAATNPLIVNAGQVVGFSIAQLDPLPVV